MTFLTLTGRDVHTVAQARRLWCSTRDRIARRHPLTASVGVVHFKDGRAHVHAFLAAPRAVPHRTARSQARAAGWGPIAHIAPILNAGEASTTSIYVTSQLRGAHAWPKGGKQLRVTAFSRSWDRMREEIKPVASSVSHNAPAGVDNGVLPAIAAILRRQGLEPAPGLQFGLSVRELASHMHVGRRVAARYLDTAVKAGEIEPVAEAKGQRSPRWRTGPQSLWLTDVRIDDDASKTDPRPLWLTNVRIGEIAQKIVAILEHGPASPGELAKQIDVTPRTITRALTQLEDRGAIQRTHRLITLIPEAGARCGSQLAECPEEPTSSDPSASVAAPPGRRPVVPLFDRAVWEESKRNFLAAHADAVASHHGRKWRSAPRRCKHDVPAAECGTCKAIRAMDAEETTG